MLKKFDFETQTFSFFRQKEMAQTQCLSHFILAGVEGLEPSRTVLETGMLPLHHTPISKVLVYYTICCYKCQGKNKNKGKKITFIFLDILPRYILVCSLLLYKSCRCIHQ